MAIKTCILCGEDLDKYKTNLEHYVPATAIRNFDQLCIPKEFDYALRINSYKANGDEEKELHPRSEHKKWATVRVHERCNQDASPMCQDLKWIIDHLDECVPDYKFKSIIEYYAHIWGVAASMVYIELYDAEEADQRLEKDSEEYYNGDPMMLLYSRGILDLGRIYISVDSPEDRRLASEPGVEKHTIYLGARESFNWVG